jgi:hypothetical protein
VGELVGCRSFSGKVEQKRILDTTLDSIRKPTTPNRYAQESRA